MKMSTVKKILLDGLGKHGLVAGIIAALFSIRFINCLPFSGFTRAFNYETITTLSSYFIYAAEPISFPIGAIKGMTFPFNDANVGNVGAIPLFAVFFKLIGQAFPYFLTFDYFIFVEILSCFITAYFSQKTLFLLGVRDGRFTALGALLTATSFLFLTRSGWLQPFCVASFPLLGAWLYGMLLTLRDGRIQPLRDAAVMALFPIAALVDNYSLFAILLATSALLLRELYEALFGNLAESWRRTWRLFGFCAGGSLLALLALYVIGMFPLPPLPQAFSSYDFGLGGRYHVADVFAPWIPVANKIYGFAQASLPARLGFPFTTDNLGEGQYEGVGYLGTPVVLLWIAIGFYYVWARISRASIAPSYSSSRVPIYSPWRKVGLAAVVVFIFSMGYELRILGQVFPDFAGMPAAWLADRIPAIFNMRATGRLAALLSFFLILESIRLFYIGYFKGAIGKQASDAHRWRVLGSVALISIALLHLIEVRPFLQPVAVQSLRPFGGVFTESEIQTLRTLAKDRDIALIAPSVRAVDVQWTTVGFSAGYFLGIKSNLYYLARTLPDHDSRIARDLDKVNRGDWAFLTKEYGNRILIVIPNADADRLRSQVTGNFAETKVGPVSIWRSRSTDGD